MKCPEVVIDFLQESIEVCVLVEFPNDQQFQRKLSHLAAGEACGNIVRELQYYLVVVEPSVVLPHHTYKVPLVPTLGKKL